MSNAKSAITAQAPTSNMPDQLRAAAAQESESEKNQPQALIPGTEQTSNFEELAKQVELLGEKSQNILEENGMLRVLASLGLTIGEFTHEVRHALAALKVGMELLESNALSKEVISDVKDNVLLLQSYVRYFDNAIIQNAHRSLSAHELRDLVREFSEVVRPSLDRQNIQLTYDFNGYDLFTKPMHKSEWSSILLNLFTNSLKAIQRAQAKGKIHIVGGRDDGQLYLKFSDNGDGIPDDNVEKVFDAFFTTSAPPSALWQIGHQAVAVRGIHVPGMLWDGNQEPGFLGVQASFDEVGVVAAHPELFEGLAGVFGTQIQLLAVPDVSNSQNHQGAYADPNPCLAFGWGGTVWFEQHLGVGAEVGFSDLGEVNQDRGVFATGVPVWVGNFAKPVHPPVGIVIRKCRDVEGLLWSCGCSTAGR
jgi:hypothetical protein